MKILAIDPGTTQSAFVAWDTETMDFTGSYRMGLWDNEKLKEEINKIICDATNDIYSHTFLVAIEMIQSYGLPLGRSSILTILFIGQLIEKMKGYGDWKLYGRPTIKGWIGGKTDAQIRASLRERYGEAKKGEKLAGVKKDIWSALALATALTENPKLKEW